MNNEGWICPKCGRVYSPWMPICTYCEGNTQFQCNKWTPIKDLMINPTIDYLHYDTPTINYKDWIS